MMMASKFEREYSPQLERSQLLTISPAIRNPGRRARKSRMTRAGLKIDIVASFPDQLWGLVRHARGRKEVEYRSAERSAIYAQGCQARGQGRGLHSEQFRRTSTSGDLAVGLLKGGNNGVSLLTSQLLACKHGVDFQWLGNIA